LLASASVDLIRVAVAQIRRHFPDAKWVVYLRDSVRSELEPELAGFELRSDRTRGRLISFARTLRGERFDQVFVIFGGGTDHWKLKMLAFVAGGRVLTTFNENGDFFEWNRKNHVAIRQHLKWRLTTRGERPELHLPAIDPALQLLKRVYSWTLGPLLGSIYLVGKLTYLEVTRARTRP
jgi:hypothetical protein